MTKLIPVKKTDSYQSQERRQEENLVLGTLDSEHGTLGMRNEK